MPAAVSHGEAAPPPLLKQPPPLLTRLKMATFMFLMQCFLGSVIYLRGWKQRFNRPAAWPDHVKRYPVRPSLPVRIFYPASYAPGSGVALPLVVTIHGGCFCFGHVREQDEWNREFADLHGVLVVSLEYSKAPQSPFPAALFDLEALILAVLADGLLPIRRRSASDPGAGVGGRGYTAIIGFSAGANLAMAVTQLPSLRSHLDGPMAVVDVYGCIDMSRPTRTKAANRPYKSALTGLHGAPIDMLLSFSDIMDWGYIPYGQDLRDPLVSPSYAKLEHLPPFIAFIGAELDMLAYENWQMACRLRADARLATMPGKTLTAGELKRIPHLESEDPRLRIVGKPEVGDPGRPLEGTWDWETRTGERDERFGWEEEWTTRDGLARGLKWLLVPDVTHGFDDQLLRSMRSDKDTIQSDRWKQTAYMKELGGWLTRTVWQL